MKIIPALVLVVALAACSGGDDGSATTTTAPTTTVQATTGVVVHVEAERILNCSASPIVNGSQLVISDEHGTKVATATFGTTGTVCDWLASTNVPIGSKLYTLEVDGQELATVDLEAQNWNVELHVDLDGTVTVAA